MNRTPSSDYFTVPLRNEYKIKSHVTVCRRAERAILRLVETDEVEENIFIIINRLSDFLFVIERREGVLKKYE